MGRSTEIYMLHKENASVYLYGDLKYKRLYQKTFKEFFDERSQQYGSDYDVMFEVLLSVISKDINKISPIYLYEIIHYLEMELEYGKYKSGLDWKLDSDLRAKNKRELNAIYENYGISLLYEIHITTDSSSYIQQFWNFEKFFPINGDYDDGYNISSKDFLMFNDYVILTMFKIIESGLPGRYNINDLDRNEINKVVRQYLNNKIMHQCVEKEFYRLKSCLIKADEAYKAEKNTVYWAGEFLNQALKMKFRIDPKKNPRIVIIDG
jgi:hypothetical protein